MIFSNVNLNLKLKLTAPTGKAATRISTEGLKKYKKWFKLMSKKPQNISVRDAESLMDKHKDLVSSQFNRQTYFTIENLIEEVKELEND